MCCHKSNTCIIWVGLQKNIPLFEWRLPIRSTYADGPALLCNLECGTKYFRYHFRRLGNKNSSLFHFDALSPAKVLCRRTYSKYHISTIAMDWIESRLKKVSLLDRALLFVGDDVCWCFFTGSLLWGKVVTLECSRNLATASRPSYTKSLLIRNLFGSLR